MKKLTILYFSFFIFHFSFSQSWLWGKNGLGFGYGLSVNSDGKGNCYLSGYYLSQDSIDFSGDILKNPHHNAFGNSMFIVKYDHSGNVLWANQSINYGNTNDINGGTVALDYMDNAYVIGAYTDTAIVGSQTFVFPSPHNISCYLAKYNSNGNFVWANAPTLNYSDTSNISFNSVSTDRNGNIFATGLFNADTIYFGSYLMYGNRYFTLPFLIKYDSNGIVLWATTPRPATKTNINDGGDGMSVVTDKNGNAYMAGLFGDSLIFGSDSLTTQQYYSLCFYIVKYNSAGNLQWANQGVRKSTTCGFGIEGFGMTVDKSGNIYAAGEFGDTVMFGSYTLIGTGTSNGQGNIFVVKYDSNGNVLWAKQSKVLDNNSWGVYSLSIDNYNHVYLSGGGGKGQCKLAFGTDTLSLNDTAMYDQASIILKFDSNGNMLCGSILQGGAQFGNGIGSDTSGNYVYYASTAGTFMTFGKDTIAPYAYPVEQDIGFNYFPFVARWEACDTNAVTASIPNVNPVGQVNLYPNPNTGTFTIALQNVNEPAQVEVYNVLGEEIYQSKLNFSNTQINLGAQPNGVYLYRVIKQTGEFIGSGKLIIDR